MSDQHKPADGVGHAPEGEAPHWLERPENVNKIVKGLYAVSALLFLFDWFVHKHSNFAIEHVFGFYGLYGFIGCVFLVVAAKGMRTILMRPEDYYDR
ncbi:MAG: hypothetical protein R3D68_18085 [Hyphomicrobiaceae bacterium]